MGAYLRFDFPQAKDKQLEVKFPTARRIAPGESLPLPSEMSVDEALVCVVFNDDQNFDAAAIALDDSELARFMQPNDRRRKKWYVMNRADAITSAGITADDFNEARYTARPGTQDYAVLRSFRAPEFPEDPIEDLPPPFEIITADSFEELLGKAGLE